MMAPDLCDGEIDKGITVAVMAQCLEVVAGPMKDAGLSLDQALERMTAALSAAWEGRPVAAEVEWIEGVAFNAVRFGLDLAEAIRRSRAAFAAGWEYGFVADEEDEDDDQED